MTIAIIVLFANGIFLLVWYYFGDPSFMRSPPWSWVSFGPTALPGTISLIIAVVLLAVHVVDRHKHHCHVGEQWRKESHMCVAICPPMGCV